MLKNERNAGFRRSKYVTAGVLGLLGLMNAANAQVTTGISSGSASPGGTVSLNVSANMTGSDAAAALQWTMNYPSADVTGVSVAVGPTAVAAGKSVSCAPNGSSTTCVVYGMNQSLLGNGTVAVATFQLASSASDATIPVQLSNEAAADPTGTALADSGSGGNITVIPPVPQVGLMCGSTSINTPGSSACSISLSQPAPTAGFVVGLASSNSSLTFPASLTVASGASSANFNVASNAVSSPQSAVLSATGGSNAPSITLSLVPPAPSAQLAGVSCSPSSITTPGNTSCSVSLTGAAPAGGFSLSLTSGSSALSLPTSVTVQAGASTATFTAAASAVTATQTASITAKSSSGGSASTSVSLVKAVTAAPAPVLTGISCPKNPLKSGETFSCTVSLSSANTATSAIVVSIWAVGNVSTPTSAVVGVGASSGTFKAVAQTVTSSQQAVIYASYAGKTVSTTVSLKK